MSNRLQALPEELLQEVLERLQLRDIAALCLAGSWGYRVGTPRLWREVNLVDCRTPREDGCDEHDDTPLIKKLVILASKPKLAAHVQIVSHRCHLPTPAIFNELPQQMFSSHTLSCDPRTITLVRAAVKLMVRVHTLRIVYGHPHLVDALIRCFFDAHRQGQTPVRRLWLESCRISAACDPNIEIISSGLPQELNFDGLKSVRFRRLPIRPGLLVRHYMIGDHATAARGQTERYVEGQNGYYKTTLNLVWSEQAAGVDPELAMSFGHSRVTREARFQHANAWDDNLYAQLRPQLDEMQCAMIDATHIADHSERSEYAYRGPFLDPVHDVIDDETQKWVASSAWKQQREARPSNQAISESWIRSLIQLFRLRFPSLRAFQLRNAVVEDTICPIGIYLLDHCQSVLSTTRHLNSQRTAIDVPPELHAQLDLAPLEFLESHPQLQCLAWPMDQFFSETAVSSDIADRVDAVIDNLGRTLVDVRIDTAFLSPGERMSDDRLVGPLSGSLTQSENRLILFADSAIVARDRRRAFISRFAARMAAVTSIKIEGGVPRDERRETLRALRLCRLERIILIGVSFPLGNTWGLRGVDLPESVYMDDVDALEAEDKATIWSLGTKPLAPASSKSSPSSNARNEPFEPSYGWSGQAPFLHTIASLHGASLTELKCCGFKGAPALLTPTPITAPLLVALKYLHSLESLVFGLWLNTRWEDALRDTEILEYWRDSQNPSSTALARVIRDTDDEPVGWEKELRTKFAPDALAQRVTDMIGPWLSDVAKGRRGGVHVRASFVLGEALTIHEIDLRVGRGAPGSSVCLGFHGPRDELEPERRKSKLDSRRWF